MEGITSDETDVEWGMGDQFLGTRVLRLREGFELCGVYVLTMYLKSVLFLKGSKMRGTK